MNSNSIYLAQTDTTVGFLSSNDKKLANIKNRTYLKRILQVIDSYKYLLNFTRIPKEQKNKVRRSKKTTFIYPNSLSFRVIDTLDEHHNLISKFNFLYSTSANKTTELFNEEFALNNSDVIIYNKVDFNEFKSSVIYKITNKKIRKLR